LSGKSEVELLRRAAAMGFKVNLVFIGLSRPEISARRVALRVKRGGHDVPAEDIARRFERILANLPAAMGAAERCLVLDNSGRRPRLLLVLEAGRPARPVGHWPPWLRRAFAAGA
jgi:predicted ABC-type ATPase